MKKKYILIMLLLVFLVKNPKVYADEYCDKLSEYKEYTNLCRYEFLDGTNPVTANLYIGNGYTMIEWPCTIEIPNEKQSKNICNNTLQQIKSNEGEREEYNTIALTKYKFKFTNSINVQSCPSYIYFYNQSLGSINLLERYFKWVPKKSEEYTEENILSKIDNSGETWRKLEIVKDCSNAVVEPEPEEPEEVSCDLIDKDIMDTLNEVMTYIRIGIPILLIGLIIFDFASAMFASSEDKMKKAQSKAIKRVIIAIIIFFVPTLINLILNIANDVWSNANFETCGLK